MGLVHSDRRRGGLAFAAACIAVGATLLMLAARPAEATVFSNPTPTTIGAGVGVGIGSHSFEVKATDAAGNTGAGAKYGFKVVKKPTG
jgi:hypothetical protein